MSVTPATGEPAPEMAAALARLWTRFLPEIEARVAVIESTIALLAAGDASAEALRAARQAAHEAAHKLAGTLGTFGMMEGTTLARALEVAFAAEADVACDEPRLKDADMTTVEQLRAQVARLRAVVASRAGSKPGDIDPGRSVR